MLFPSVNRQKGWLVFVLVGVISLNLYFHFTFEGTLKDRARWLDSIFGNILGPIQKMTSFTQVTLVDGMTYFIRLNEALDENETLKNEIIQYRFQLHRAKEVEAENDRLREALHFKERIKLEFISSKVVARDLSLYFRSILINRGSQDKIEPKMPVISSEGVVGQVLRTNLTTSVVLLISDVNSRVDSRVERSRIRAIVGGSPSGDLDLRFLSRRQDLKLDDHLITTGFGGIFPEGFKVGRVVRMSSDPHFVLDEVQLEPAVNFDALEEVFVVTNLGDKS